MKKYFTQKQWYRNWYPNRTFIFVDNIWKDLDEYIEGEKIEKVDGRWTTQSFCKCGNELIHSGSVSGIKQGENVIYTFKCKHCKLVSYRRPDLIPGLLPCDKHGTPLN